MLPLLEGVGVKSSDSVQLMREVVWLGDLVLGLLELSINVYRYQQFSPLPALLFECLLKSKEKTVDVG